MHGGPQAQRLGVVRPIGIKSRKEIARFSAAFSAVIGANYLVSTPLFLFGNEEQKLKYLRSLARGERLAAHAMTEPSAGSDVAGLAVHAEAPSGAPSADRDRR